MKQRGGSRFHLLVALLLTAAIILTAVRIIPVYVRSYEFEDFMRSEAKFAGVRKKSPQDIKKDLLKKAQELNLPVTGERITVSPARNGVRITASYAMPVDLVVYTHTFSFDFQVDTASAY